MDNIKVSEITEKFPKAVKSFGEYIKPILLYGVEEAEITQELIDSMVDSIISNAPRFLYDFFDSVGLYISITYRGEGDWEYSISSTELVEILDSRPKAEQQAFYNAFKALNDKL